MDSTFEGRLNIVFNVVISNYRWCTKHVWRKHDDNPFSVIPSHKTNV